MTVQLFGPRLGECFIADFEPHGLLDHTCEWHLVDITDPDTKVSGPAGIPKSWV